MIAFTSLEIALGSIILFFGVICAIMLFFFLIIFNHRFAQFLDSFLTWTFPFKRETPTWRPPQSKLLDCSPTTNSVDRSTSLSAFPSPFQKQTPNLVDYLIDPDAKLLCVYVSLDSIKYGNSISAKSSFTENVDALSNIKLIRSGTGFRVYNHPTIKDGQWLSCR